MRSCGGKVWKRSQNGSATRNMHKIKAAQQDLASACMNLSACETSFIKELDKSITIAEISSLTGIQSSGKEPCATFTRNLVGPALRILVHLSTLRCSSVPAELQKNSNSHRTGDMVKLCPTTLTHGIDQVTRQPSVSLQRHHPQDSIQRCLF